MNVTDQSTEAVEEATKQVDFDSTETKPDQPQPVRRKSALTWMIPLILLVAAGCMGFVYFSGFSDPSAVQKEASNFEPRIIGKAELTGMPGFGNLDLGNFTPAVMEDKFGEITDGLMKIDAETAPEIVATIDGVTESLPSLGLEGMSDGIAPPVNAFLGGFRSHVKNKIDAVSDDSIKEQIEPALAELWTRLKEDYVLPRPIKTFVE